MNETMIKTKQYASYLTFKLGKEHFALNVGNVINILEMQSFTKIPKSPKYLTGMVNLRGEVLPVIDTNVKLGFDSTEITFNTCILVIETTLANTKLKFGILVDSVQEVLEFDNAKILPPPVLGDSLDTKVISGLIEQEDEFIMILDIQEFLESNEILNIQKLHKKL